MANKNPSPGTRFRTGKKQESIARKGGYASGKSKRALKAMAEIDQEITTNEERIQMLTKLKELAMKGNLKAFELYRDTVGLKPGKPETKAYISRADLEELEAFLYGDDYQKEGTTENECIRPSESGCVSDPDPDGATETQNRALRQSE